MLGAKLLWFHVSSVFHHSCFVTICFQRNRANRKQREKEQKADEQEVGSLVDILVVNYCLHL